MKYLLTAVIKGRTLEARLFSSRDKANRAMFKLIDANGLQVEEEFSKDRGHWQEFICDNYNRFIVSRVSA